MQSPVTHASPQTTNALNEKSITIDHISLHDLFSASNSNINSKFSLLRIVVRGSTIKLIGSKSETDRYEHHYRSGRMLDSAVAILDEAQNTSRE